MPGWDQTENEIRYRLKEPNFDRYARKEIQSGVSIVIGWKGKKSTVQALRFSKKKGWTLEKAKKWLADHRDKFQLEVQDIVDILPKRFIKKKPEYYYYSNPPYSRRIWDGSQTSIVTPRSYKSHLNTPVLLIDDNLTYGIIELSDPIELLSDEFSQLESRHGISEEEREKLAKKNNKWISGPLYMYGVKVHHRYNTPIPVRLRKGIQTWGSSEDVIFTKLKNATSMYLLKLHSFLHAFPSPSICPVHWSTQLELADRGLQHGYTNWLDRNREWLISDWRQYKVTEVADDVLRDDHKITHTWVKWIKKNKRGFTTTQWKDVPWKKQLRIIKKLHDSIAKEFIKKGWEHNTPVSLADVDISFMDYNDLKIINIKFIDKLADNTLSDLHSKIHKMYKKSDKITEPLFNIDSLVMVEMRKRKLLSDYIDVDELDKIVRHKWIEYPEPDLELEYEPDKITLDLVLNALRKSGNILIKGQPFGAYLSGKIVNMGEISKDGSRDIEIVCKQEPDPRIVTAFKSIKPKWLADKLHITFDPEGPAIGYSIPVYGYSLNPLPKEWLIKGFGALREKPIQVANEQKLELGKDFIDLKPKSGFGKHEWFDIKSAWDAWGADNIKAGLLIQEKVDGRRFSVHFDRKDNLFKIMTDDRQKDVSDQYPEIKEEFIKSKIDNIVLNGEMLSFECPSKISPKNARTKREIGTLTFNEDKKNIVFVFYDILYLNGENLSNKSAEDRFDILSKTIPNSAKYLDVVRGSKATTMREFFSNIAKYRSVHGSEGVVIKRNDSIYPIKYSGENRTDKWCLTGGSYLLTENGFSKVCEIKPGIKIFSADGKLHPVKDIVHRKIEGFESLYDVKSDDGFRVRLTGNHTILTNPSGWISAEALKGFKSFYPDISIPDEEAPKSLLLEFHGYKKYVLCDEDFWRLMGFWVAEGSLGSNRNKLYHRGTFVLYQKDIKTLFKYSSDIEYLFDAHPVLQRRKVKASSIYFWDKPLCEWISENFLHENNTKTVPWFLVNLSDSSFNAFLEGWKEGDGHTEPNGRIRIGTSDPTLAGRMYAILLKRGYNISVQYRKPKKGRDHFTITFRKTRSNKKLYAERVYTDYNDLVYDIEVDGASSYLGPSLVLSNSKIKNLKEIDVMVWETLTKKSSTWMYLSVFEIPKDEVPNWYKGDVIQHEDKYYAKIGKSYGSGKKAKKGDIITVMPVRIKESFKNNKRRVSWVYPYFKEIKLDKKEPDTWTTVQRLIKIGTGPSPVDKHVKIMTDEEFDRHLDSTIKPIIAEFSPCVYSTDLTICPLASKLSKLSKTIVIEKLKFPVSCVLAYFSKCAYLKDYYYDFTKVHLEDKVKEQE